MSDPGRRLLYASLAVLVVLLDQATKALVIANLPLFHSTPVIAGFFELTHIKNTGAAFGIFAGIDSPLRTLFLNGVAIAVFVVVLLYALRSPAAETRLQTGLALILGGAVGNLIDRVRFGQVTDFLDFHVGEHRWPAFNAADSAITIGVLLLAWDIFRSPESEAGDGKAAEV